MRFSKPKRAASQPNGLIIAVVSIACIVYAARSADLYLKTGSGIHMTGGVLSLTAAVVLAAIALRRLHRHYLLQQFHYQFGCNISSDWPFRQEFVADNTRYTIACFNPHDIVVSEETIDGSEMLVIHVYSGQVSAQRHLIESLRDEVSVDLLTKKETYDTTQPLDLNKTEVVRRLQDIVRLAPVS